MEDGGFMRFLVLLLCLCLQAATFAQTAPPEVDAAEVLRRGDLVTVAGEGPRAAEDNAIAAATAPPADDSSMWFVTVIKTRNCVYCDKLIADFQKAPELQAFISVAAPNKPWGHYNVFDASDQTQQWRLKDYKIAGYPTLVIQPPRNGMWGNPRTVVFQKSGYDGNAAALAKEITTGVRRYATAMSKQGYPKIQATADAIPLSNSFVAGGSEQVAVNPPFNTPPKVDPFNPTPSPAPTVFPQFPPVEPAPTPAQPQLPSLTQVLSILITALGSLMGAQGAGNLLLLIMVALWVLELIAPKTETKADDQVVAFLKELLDHLKSNPPTNPPSGPAS